MPNLKKQLIGLENELQQPSVYMDVKKATLTSKKITELSQIIDSVSDIRTSIDDAGEFIQILDEGNDDQLENQVTKQINILEKKVEDLFLLTLLSDKYDKYNAIVKIHSGAGGTEACDWVSMLQRMYNMWAKSNGFDVVLIDSLDGDGGGFKSIVFEINGSYAYGYLKSEIGVHRLVRNSPFDSAKRRHTSFASVEVMPQVEDDLEVVVKDEDLRIDTFRSSGAGGQHVNKTDSAVRITHIPTNVVAVCQNERSQIKNRETALKILKSKLLAIKVEENRQNHLKIKGESKKIEWGSQIRSYVFCPYTLVTDHRTNLKDGDVLSIMNGNIKDFIIEYLKWSK